MAHKQGFYIRYWEEVDTSDSTLLYKPIVNFVWGTPYPTSTEAQNDALKEKHSGFTLYYRLERNTR